MRYDRILVIQSAPYPPADDAWFQNSMTAVRHARMAADTLHLEAYASPDLSLYTTVLLVVHPHRKLPADLSERLDSFVRDGGGFVVVRPYWDETLAAVLGGDDASSSPSLVRRTEIIRFVEDFVPGLKGHGESLEGNHLTTSPRDVFVFAESEVGRPMAWIGRVGAGRTVVFNSAMGCRGWAPGLITEAVLRTHECAVRPLVNAGLVQIDDFPAPSSTSRREPVASRYGMSMMEFFQRLWQPHMLELAERFGLHFTFLIPFNYDAAIREPFDFPEWERAKLEGETLPFGVQAARSLLPEHELGLHGYNHQPFVLEHWRDVTQMRKALRASVERWRADLLGPLPRTYAPPGNQYDETAIRLLTEECPTLTSICGYLHDSRQHGILNDFGPDPWNPALMRLPRNTAGYERSDSMTLSMLSLLSSLGVWNHFFHPDDVFDLPTATSTSGAESRNPACKQWRADSAEDEPGLFDALSEWFEFAERFYPWLRHLKAEEAGPLIGAYVDSDVRVRRDPCGLTLQSTEPGYYELILDESVDCAFVPPPDVELVSVVSAGGVRRYVLATKSADVHLELSPGPCRGVAAHG